MNLFMTHAVMTPVHECLHDTSLLRTMVNCFVGLTGMYTCMAESGRFMTVDQVAELQRCYALWRGAYNWLAQRALDEGRLLWPLRPKQHQVEHMRLRLIVPRVAVAPEVLRLCPSERQSTPFWLPSRRRSSWQAKKGSTTLPRGDLWPKSHSALCHHDQPKVGWITRAAVKGAILAPSKHKRDYRHACFLFPLFLFKSF